MKTPGRRAPVCGAAVVLGLIVGITSFPDPAKGHFPAPVMRVDATLSQLMRGALCRLQT